LPRIAVAALVVAFAAATSRRWLVPVGVTLALPVVWLNGLAILAAVPALRLKDDVRMIDASIGSASTAAQRGAST
jgi:hypothetical protein